jgi:hypothetical protein
MKTAVEWLEDEVDRIIETYDVDMMRYPLEKAYEKAKEMEWEQKIKMLKTFLYNTQTGEDVEDVEGWFEQYETFKQQEQ